MLFRGLKSLLICLTATTIWSSSTLAAGYIDTSAMGVRCDGNTDNADRLDDIAQAASEGALIYFPPTVHPCLTSRPFRIPSNSTVWAIPGSVVLAPTESNTSSSLLLNIDGRHDIRIFGLILDGREGLFATNRSLATVFKSNHIIFDHATFRNSQGVAIVFSTEIIESGVISGSVQNVGNRFITTHVRSDQLQGIDFCCGKNDSNRANFVIDTDFVGIGLDALAVSDQVDFSALNNTFRGVGGRWDFGGAGIWSSNISGLTLSNNEVVDAKGNGFDLSFLSQATITRNTVSQSGGGGIEISSSKNVIVSYNITNDNWQSSHLNGATPSQHQGGITLDVVPNPMSDIILKGNIATNTNNNNTQQFGLQIRGSRPITGLEILNDNHFDGNALQAVRRTDATSTIP